MDKILITQGTTPFAQRVSKLLVPTYNILYGSSEAFPDLLIKNGYRKIPRGGSPTFAHEVLKLCLDENCLFVLPLGKEELAGLHQSRILFGEYGISVLIPKNLEDAMIIEKPELGLPLQIFSDGVDLVSGAKLENQNFSGVGISSDDQDAVVLCLT